MKCPRCQALVSASPDASGLVVCPTCGARLRTKPSLPGSKTQPPGTPLPPFARPSAIESTLVNARTSGPRAGAAEAPAPAAPAAETGLDRILGELRALREGQDEMLALLRGRTGHHEPEPLYQEPALHRGGEPGGDADARPSAPPVVRSRRRKTVLVMDDDATTRAECKAAMDKAEVPVRLVDDGNAGLAAIAAEKPDVIVLELDLGGSMAGRDVVNMIKATMEWIDIPLVLYTRLPIESQKEARQLHGADELVRKGPGSAETLVSRVISVFRSR
jgi:CheY-like chemotaxis protein/DNA-directed RNA polymerase subunit RPC12/RpoP